MMRYSADAVQVWAKLHGFEDGVKVRTPGGVEMVLEGEPYPSDDGREVLVKARVSPEIPAREFWAFPLTRVP
jgi:hypothetical protein